MEWKVEKDGRMSQRKINLGKKKDWKVEKDEEKNLKKD